MVEEACNYNPLATVQDESCDFLSCLIFACTDPSACNYNPEADFDDGSCEEFDECGVCGGDGIPEGDCDCDGNQLDALEICGGSCEADENNNGICDEDDIFGCTIEDACNYNSDATVNDGTCDFESCLILGCTDPNACNYNPDAELEDGSCSVSYTHLTLPTICSV